MPASRQSKVLSYFESFPTHTYPRGTVIVRTDEAENSIFCVKSGFVKAYTIEQQGQIDIQFLEDRPNIFPLTTFIMALINKEEHYFEHTLYYETMVDSDIWIAPKESFYKFVHENKAAFDEILIQLFERYANLVHRGEILSMRHAEQKIAYQIYLLTQRYGKRTAAGIAIDAPIKHQDLADMLSLARETVTREMNKFKQRGLLPQEADRVVITDIEKLKAIAIR